MTQATGIETAAAPQTAASRRWLVAGVLLLVVIAGFFDRISIAVLFTNKDFNDALGTGSNPALLGLLMTSFLFAYGASGVLLSFLGPRRSLAIGAGVWAVFMALIGSTGSYGLMLFYGSACRDRVGRRRL